MSDILVTIMPPTDTTTTMDMRAIALENNRLLLENNQILNKMERRATRAFWFKIIWFIVLFVLPLLFLPYLFNSYLNSLKIAGDESTDSPAFNSTDSMQQVLDLLQKQ